MKKSIILFLMCFLVIGIMFSSVNVLADDDDDNKDSDSGSSENRGSDNSNNDDSDSSSDSVKDDDDDEKDEKENEIKSKTKEKITFTDASGNRVEITTEIKIKNGEQEIKIKKKIIDINGNVRKIEIKIEIEEEDGIIIRKIKFKDEIKGEFEAKTKLKIKEEVSGNESIESILKAILSDGSEHVIKIMPDRVAEIAIEKLKTMNYTIELKEIEHKNVPRVIYNIETNKHGKFLGIFKIKIRLEAQVDPETGEFLGIAKPWWAFLITGEDDPEPPISIICSDYAYSLCPTECEAICIPSSCSFDNITNSTICTDDCEGVGSCIEIVPITNQTEPGNETGNTTIPPETNNISNETGNNSI